MSISSAARRHPCAAVLALTLLPTAMLALSPAALAARAYVSNEDDGTVAVIDTARGALIATVTAGKRPRGLALSPDGSRLYVVVSGLPKCPPPISDAECARLPRDPHADGVAVIDTATLARTRVLTGVSDPERIAVSRDGRRLFISEEDAGRLAVLDAAHDRVLATVPVGREPEGVRVTPDGRWVLVTSETDNQVSIVDAKSYAVAARVGVGKRPRDLAVTPDGRFAYVSGEADASLYRIALPAGPAQRVLELRKEDRPMGVALDAARGRLYLSTGHGGTVAVVSLDGPKLLGEIQVGGRPWGIALDDHGRRLYTADGPAGNVSIVDTGSSTLTGTIAAGHGPWGVAVGP